MRQDRLWMYGGRVTNGLLSSEFIDRVEQFIAFIDKRSEAVNVKNFHFFTAFNIIF